MHTVQSITFRCFLSFDMAAFLIIENSVPCADYPLVTQLQTERQLFKHARLTKKTGQ